MMTRPPRLVAYHGVVCGAGKRRRSLSKGNDIGRAVQTWQVAGISLRATWAVLCSDREVSFVGVQTAWYIIGVLVMIMAGFVGVWLRMKIIWVAVLARKKQECGWFKSCVWAARIQSDSVLAATSVCLPKPAPTLRCSRAGDSLQVFCRPRRPKLKRGFSLRTKLGCQSPSKRQSQAYHWP